MSILVIGSVALDNVKTPFGEIKNVLGGSAVYFSYAASFLVETKLVGVVGEDFPKEYLTLLKKRNIDIQGLQITKDKTFTWDGEYGDNLSEPKTISICLNALKTFKPSIPESYKNTKYLFLANIDPELQLQVLEQVKNPYKIFCDTRDFWIKYKKELLLEVLKKVDVLILNESEIRLLCEENNLIKATKQIFLLGPKIVIVKKGEHGVILFSPRFIFATIGYPLEEVYDPTGAGDAFAGGFIGYLAKYGNFKEESLKKAVIYGSVLASFTVEDFSIHKLLVINEEDIRDRFLEFKKLTYFK